MYSDTAALNFSISWKDYWMLPIVAILHVIIITYHVNPQSFNIAAAPNLETPASRMQVSLNRVKPSIVRKTITKPRPIKKKSVIKKQKTKSVKQVAKVQKSTSPSNNTHKLKALELAKKNFNSLLRSYSRPNYPRRELRRGITGEVILGFWVKGNGKVVQLKILRSSGNKALDLSALEAAKRWKFKDLGVKTAQVIQLNKKVVYQIN